MNERIQQLKESTRPEIDWEARHYVELNNGEKEKWMDEWFKKFAELIVKECINREELLGAIARGWCSEKNSHKTMDSDLAVAIFDQVEQQIKQHFGFEE